MILTGTESLKDHTSLSIHTTSEKRTCDPAALLRIRFVQLDGSEVDEQSRLRKTVHDLCDEIPHFFVKFSRSLKHPQRHDSFGTRREGTHRRSVRRGVINQIARRQTVRD